MMNHGKFGFGPLKQSNVTDDWLLLKTSVYLKQQTEPLYKNLVCYRNTSIINKKKIIIFLTQSWTLNNSADSLRLKLGWHILTYETYTQIIIYL